MLAVTMHIYSNYRAVKSVVMETLNQSRLHIVSQVFLDSDQQQITGVMNPAATNPLEPVLWSKSIPRNLNSQLRVLNLILINLILS